MSRLQHVVGQLILSKCLCHDSKQYHTFIIKTFWPVTECICLHYMSQNKKQIFRLKNQTFCTFYKIYPGSLGINPWEILLQLWKFVSVLQISQSWMCLKFISDNPWLSHRQNTSGQLLRCNKTRHTVHGLSIWPKFCFILYWLYYCQMISVVDTRGSFY